MDEIRTNETEREEYRKLPVDRERVMQLSQIMQKYKAGKRKLEQRVVEAEKWWKIRNEAVEDFQAARDGSFHAKSGWLHNVLVAKHADAMDSYPEALVLPREPTDRQEAAKLSAILPVILEQNRFKRTYSRGWWDKLKTGTAVYQIKWDPDKLGGLGEVDIGTVDLLNIFWEPGIEDIQRSRYLFMAELRDDELLEEEYPELKGKLGGESMTLTNYVYDDTVSTEGKSLVVDAYYKKREGGRIVLHYCKFVGDTVLYATENGDEMAAAGEGGSLPSASVAQDPAGETGANGLYNDGRYPFVFDPLWPIKGSPCGYGYVDLCKNPQTTIDMMDSAFVKNFNVNVSPRYFSRQDGNVNEEEFKDLAKPIVHVAGNVDEASLRAIVGTGLSGNYLAVYQNKITELRETSGNTESANGVYSSGVTAASAIAAMQEASGKTSRDASNASYEVFGEIADMVIERVRQFYSIPRQFRITGQMGEEQFTTYDNSGILPQNMGGIGQEDLGMRLPVFDIRIETQKKNAYTRTSQNELMLQFFNLGFFNPQFATQAVACAQQMDFDNKEAFLQVVRQNGTLFDKFQQLSQYVIMLLQKYEPQNAEPMMESLGLAAPLAGGGGPVKLNGEESDENGVVQRARERANSAASVQR